MADTAFAGEKMIIEENHGGASGSEAGGLQHIYFFIPTPTVTVTVTTATPTVGMTGETTQEIQVSEAEDPPSPISPSMSALPAGENEGPTVKVEAEVEAGAEGDTMVQDGTLNNVAHLIQGEPISQGEGSLQHIYFFIPSAAPIVKEDNKEIKKKNNTLTVFEIPTIIITAASAAPSRAPSQVGTEEDGEETLAADSASEAEAEVKEEEAASAEQTPTEAGNDSTDRDHDHVGKKLKTDMDSSVNVATNRSSPSGSRSPTPGRKYYHHKKKNHNGKRFHSPRTPSPRNNGNDKHYETDYTSPSGRVYTKKELNELKFGVKNERGDTVFFKPSFIEDPWVAAENEKKEESEWDVEMDMGSDTHAG